MKKLIFLATVTLFCFLTITFYHKWLKPAEITKIALNNQCHELSPPPLKAVAFDLVGVIFHINKFKALQELGLLNVARYYLRHFSNPFDDLLQLLDEMRKKVPGQFQDKVTYKGYLLPQTMIEWQKGLKTSEAMAEDIATFLDTLENDARIKDPTDRAMLWKLLSFMSDGPLRVKFMELDEDLFDYIKALRKKSCLKLFILSNLDTDLYHHLLLAYPELFSLFDGIIISGETHLLKPFPEIFTYLLDSAGLKPAECLFIDDQEENIVQADKQGFLTHHYQKVSSLYSLF